VVNGVIDNADSPEKVDFKVEDLCEYEGKKALTLGSGVQM
jgi:hypothetical protein